MNPENMVHMANQIALYFASFPREEAIAGIATHLKLYWEPRMRRQIIAYVEGGGGGLHALALEAVKRLDPAKPASFGLAGEPPNRPVAS